MQVDPIESAGLFEGDIANVSMEDLRRLRSGDYTKNAIRDSFRMNVDDHKVKKREMEHLKNKLTTFYLKLLLLDALNT